MCGLINDVIKMVFLALEFLLNDTTIGDVVHEYHHSADLVVIGMVSNGDVEVNFIAVVCASFISPVPLPLASVKQSRHSWRRVSGTKSKPFFPRIETGSMPKIVSTVSDA